MSKKENFEISFSEMIERVFRFRNALRKRTSELVDFLENLVREVSFPRIVRKKRETVSFKVTLSHLK